MVDDDRDRNQDQNRNLLRQRPGSELKAEPRCIESGTKWHRERHPHQNRARDSGQVIKESKIEPHPAEAPLPSRNVAGTINTNDVVARRRLPEREPRLKGDGRRERRIESPPALCADMCAFVV
ncbi:hypothetical protein EVAR_31762_1 [Eumeta japonica]|uniref:Uncharacterized protein n=1 Tax=Eumeta variegata TaxID=151549 RepID=A0A4C1W6Y7_EUMVA|nr:hypothetical protein EVAR_31762_1 [Eumeta japonica]